MQRTRLRGHSAEATVTVIPEENHEEYSRILQQRARRCLFAPVNLDIVNRDLQSALQVLEEISDGKSEQWNFDFENNTPLPGPIQWTLVSSGDQDEPVEDVEAFQMIQTKFGTITSKEGRSAVTPSRVVKQRSIEDFFSRGKRTFSSSAGDATGTKRKVPDSPLPLPSSKVEKVAVKK